jgi:hypothetical protein
MEEEVSYRSWSFKIKFNGMTIIRYYLGMLNFLHIFFYIFKNLKK